MVELLGSLLIRFLYPILGWLSSLRWGQMASVLAPYLIAIGVSIPLSWYGVGDIAGLNDAYDSAIESGIPLNAIDIPQNLLTFANTIFPLSDLIAALNILGACWVSRGVSTALKKVTDLAAFRSRGWQ